MATPKVIPAAFTLLELVIVLAVIGTLLTFAIPSYQRHVQRVHRADAIRVLFAVAECQARLMTETGSYDTSQCLPARAPDRYTISLNPANDPAIDHFTATATPIDGVDDGCGALSISHFGARTIENPDSTIAKCWGLR